MEDCHPCEQAESYGLEMEGAAAAVEDAAKGTVPAVSWIIWNFDGGADG